jgi:hypothetical protein
MSVSHARKNRNIAPHHGCASANERNHLTAAVGRPATGGGANASRNSFERGRQSIPLGQLLPLPSSPPLTMDELRLPGHGERRFVESAVHYKRHSDATRAVGAWQYVANEPAERAHQESRRCRDRSFSIEYAHPFQMERLIEAQAALRRRMQSVPVQPKRMALHVLLRDAEVSTKVRERNGRSGRAVT